MGGAYRAPSCCRQGEWVRRDLWRAVERGHYRPGVRDQGVHDLPVRFGVRSEGGPGSLRGTFQHRRRAVVERVGERRGRVDPLQPMIFEGERPEIWRGVTERVDGGAKVMHEAGKGDLGGAGAAADRTLGLDDGDRATVAGEVDGRREAV